MFNRLGLIAATAIVGSIPVSAHAGTAGALPLNIAMNVSAVKFLPDAQALTQPVGSLAERCENPPAALASVAAAPVNKSAAILGTQMSALDRIRLSQTGMAAQEAAFVAPSVPTAITGHDCSNASVSQRFALPATQVAPAGEYLGSRRIEIGKSKFDDEWDRVAKRGLSRSEARRAVGRGNQATGALLDKVNRWVNGNVAYREDRNLFGRADYWADARSTLRSRKGDCEDFAILKMQLLAALGIDRDDMYLTITRDLVRNADHAVLIVNEGDRFYLLDNATDQVLAAEAPLDYRPILSFSRKKTWIHGFEMPRAAPIYLSVNDVSSARLTGLSK